LAWSAWLGLAWLGPSQARDCSAWFLAWLGFWLGLVFGLAWVSGLVWSSAWLGLWHRFYNYKIKNLTILSKSLQFDQKFDNFIKNLTILSKIS
jgi:hypothetical protein